MATREPEMELFGRQTGFEYSETWVGYALLGMRLTMGWVLFYAGIDKVLAGDWSAGGFLMGAASGENFMAGFWETMAADWLWLIDPLNMWGLTLTGLALMLGAFVRWSAFWAAIMMLFYWLASFPLEHSFIIDDHVVYAMLLFGLGAFGAGRILGVDDWLEDTEFVQNNRWMTYLLG
ncbi:DoxX family protein [Haloarchaeobius sp. HME9146]|uniref:DoxX family protein n=1 Tax=Haloarchaeobius sp. HME9146 TaxID=2978732 RepID=UPI0021C14F30|nr:DoxX family protein [Haloarchaeobius sp. HME9146]MCT9097644.1 DoxX family protein [Haloarchaeobius sp. HME9146]